MKKNYSITVLALTLFAGSVFAQSQRTILAEEFTQASCGPCAAQNPTFNALLAGNTQKVIGLKYQTNWPGVDPMNTQTQTWVGPRVTYYNVSGVPYATLDGTPQTGGSYSGAPANWNQTKIDTRYAVTSPFTLTASHSFDANYSNVDITVDIACTQATTGTFSLRVALVEKEIAFCQAPGTNGETEFYSVMRKMVPDATGTPLAGTWTVGQTQQLTFSTALPSYIYDLKKVGVVVFIQNNTTKEVFQAGISEPLPVAIDASLKDCSLPSANITCVSGFDPSVTITNEGTTAINSVDLSYSITGGSTLNYTAATSIAPGASATITLPNITIASFPSTFTCNVTSVNGGSDYVTGNNSYALTLYQVPANISIAPVTQDFVPTTFPPVDWTRINGGGTATWSRSTVGASAANGSTKMDYFNSADGDNDILYTPKIDLSNLTNPVLTFKMAKASFTGYIDQCDIIASSDCGSTWTTIWSKSDPLLSTAGALTTAFTPTSGSTTQWRNETASLSAFAGQTEVLIGFKAISGYGNNMYIDDINVQSTTGIGENEASNSISVFPTITTGDVYISMNNVKSNSNVISIYDAQGKLIETFVSTANANSQVYVNLAKYQNGIYMIHVECDSQVNIKKVVLEK